MFNLTIKIKIRVQKKNQKISGRSEWPQMEAYVSLIPKMTLDFKPVKNFSSCKNFQKIEILILFRIFDRK